MKGKINYTRGKVSHISPCNLNSAAFAIGSQFSTQLVWNGQTGYIYVRRPPVHKCLGMYICFFRDMYWRFLKLCAPCDPKPSGSENFYCIIKTLKILQDIRKSGLSPEKEKRKKKRVAWHSHFKDTIQILYACIFLMHNFRGALPLKHSLETTL